MINEDSVSEIHRRWYFTLLNPSSYKTSTIITIIASLGIVGVHHVFYPLAELVIHCVIALIIAIGGIYLDFFLLRGTPTNKLSKITHVAAFSSSLWLVTIFLGLIANIIFGKNSDLVSYCLGGLFIASGLRYGIFVSVFGARFVKSILIAFVLPVIIFVNTLPYSFSFVLQDHFNAVVIGSLIFVVGILWSVFVDKAGSPNLKSTFKILQAFLSAWTENKQEKMEDIFGSRSQAHKIGTKIIKFERLLDGDVLVVLPDIHPGPFNPIGGSNLPQEIFEFFEQKAIVLHSISDHSQNLPTTTEVNKYLESLKDVVVTNTGNKCSLPVRTESHDYTITCIDFMTTVFMIISKQEGMEDLPYSIREKIEQYALEAGYSEIMIVDAHNALGKKILPEQEELLCNLALTTLEKLKQQQYNSYKIGYCNSIASNLKFVELGRAGISVLNLQIGNQDHLIGWSDSNNMVNGLRDRILDELKKEGLNMLEVCSSDTHSSSGKRTRQGYYALGNVTRYNNIIQAFKDISRRALSNTTHSSFSYMYSYSELKLMGRDQFDIYAKALDKSMYITKVSLGFTVILYLFMLSVS